MKKKIVHEFDYLQGSYKDAWSTEHKKDWKVIKDFFIYFFICNQIQNIHNGNKKQFCLVCIT
jgi:hypothetical protein